jgi:hypothetical protein
VPTLLSTAKAYLNFARQLKIFLNNPVTYEDVQAKAKQQIINREENFLKTLQLNVFNYPQSPYIPLFKLANISYQDITRMIGRQGLENTLEELYNAGVYVTFEEFKGRIPIKRGDYEIQVKASDFDNPNLGASLYGGSGGSTGVSTKTKFDLDYIIEASAMLGLAYGANNIFDMPVVSWRGMLPDSEGLRLILFFAHYGQPVQKWYSLTPGDETQSGRYYKFLTYIMIIMGRLYGSYFPLPQYISLDNPLPIVNTISQILQDHGNCHVSTLISKSVRICLAAQKAGIDLTGVAFHGAGEPPTSAKISIIEATGARYVPHYAFIEAGNLGLACGNPSGHNDVHLAINHIACIQRPVEVFDTTVKALCYTKLLPDAPKMLLNVLSDDFGDLETRDCGCRLHQIGMTTHIRNIGSYSKLTTEGVTLVGSDMVRILEEDLPSLFGGSLLDYQLVEEETQQGLTKLFLYVDPSVTVSDESELTQAFLEAMKKGMPSTRLAQSQFRDGDVLSIRRTQPLRTSRGKHFSIRTLKM